MRIVGDQWRPDLSDPVNAHESAANILAAHKYSENELTEITKFSNLTFLKYISSKCSKICINTKTKDALNINFNNCLTNCSAKLNSSNEEFGRVSQDIYKKFHLHETAGTNYFA
jgi:hypothetical protein